MTIWRRAVHGARGDVRGVARFVRASGWLATVMLLVRTAAAQEAAPTEGSPPEVPAVEAPPAAAVTAAPVEEPAPDFASYAQGGFGDASGTDAALLFKLYGDIQFQGRSNAAVKDSFAAAHLDLFATAEVGRLSFLSEVFFEGDSNEMELDLERVQIMYLFADYLRLRAGRSHTAFGYYSDTYHHGNLFELTNARPLSVQFEDAGGLLAAHLVGAGIDGTIRTALGSFRYDLEVGNGRLADLTQVAIMHAGKNGKMGNLRLRYVHDSGVTVGANAVVDSYPAAPVGGDTPAVPKVKEQIFGAHVVYMEHSWHVLLEAFAVRHDTRARSADTTYATFFELGHRFGSFMPYGRFELIRFPERGDPIYQGPFSPLYAGVEKMMDVRVGLRFQPMPQLVLRLEAQRGAFDANDYYAGTAKVAFGF